MPNDRRKIREEPKWRGDRRGWSWIVSGAVAAVAVVAVRFCWQHDRRQPFLRWFRANGGNLSHKLTIDFFEDYGNGIGTLSRSSIAKDEEILSIPANLQITQRGALHTISSHVPPSLVEDTIRRLKEIFPSPLDQQDVLIALKLVLESCLGRASFYHPYIMLLPVSVPRLDTFHASELEILQDRQLKRFAQVSLSRLEQFFHESAQTLVRTAAMSLGISTLSAESCCSFASFHRFSGVASSRCMILDGIKYLVPIADMINHASRKEADGGSFRSYHVRDDRDGIHVMADRAVSANSQVLEEYGQLDNSLYLLAFGFVPLDNPYHCATIPSSHVPNLLHPELRSVGQLLGVHKESVCVRSDGVLLEKSDYFALVAIQDQPDRIKQCIDAVATGPLQHGRSVCIAQSSEDHLHIHSVIRDAASSVLKASGTTVAEDVALLASLESEEDVRIQTKLAMRFRIEEKKVLHAIQSLL